MKEKITQTIAVTAFFLILSIDVQATTTIELKTYPSQVFSTEVFEVNFNISDDSDLSAQYYLKGRIGSSSGSLNQAETYNSRMSAWFADTVSWVNFPTINLENGVATGSVKLRTKPTVSIGPNLITIRINKSSKSYDASASSILVNMQSLTPTSSPNPTDGAEPTSKPQESYAKVYISEAMVYPQTSESEWIELYNDNDFSVDLTNWYIDDIENGGSLPKILNINIEPKSYAVFNLTSSMFNNNGDAVRLLDFNKNFKDGFEYSDGTQGKSWGRTSFENDNFCLQEPTKNLKNSSCLVPTNSPTPTSNPTPTFFPTLTSGKNIKVKTSWISPISRFTRNSSNKTAFSTDSGQILGIESNPSQTNPIITSFSIISFSYSLLTIIGILLKMKVG